MAEQLSLLGSSAKRAPRIVYFDLETLRSADDVGGWNHIAKMGVASAVCYDDQDGRFFHYAEPEVPALIEKLKSADLVVGFNVIRFDYTVLKGYSDFNFSTIPTFDMLDDVTRRLGHRLKLDSLVQATLGAGKSGDGLQSLRWVKEGRFDLIREYCEKDVELTRDLFLFGAKEGYVYYDHRGEKARVAVEWNARKILSWPD